MIRIDRFDPILRYEHYCDNILIVWMVLIAASLRLCGRMNERRNGPNSCASFCGNNEFSGWLEPHCKVRPFALRFAFTRLWDVICDALVIVITPAALLESSLSQELQGRSWSWRWIRESTANSKARIRVLAHIRVLASKSRAWKIELYF